ncbi:MULTISPECIES: hypothetical protein [Thalassospira]|uniref:Uncharacterized protein n=1 Tax=Thalassospira profundimaris TaxID=502049 RepID=A0A367X6P7_9PROT|nr:hypothetical protein [Thalassospira profundimaris]RCK49334.1 hypothetical protein TH30_03190 [Thalassospira profundimaris]
MVEFQGKMSIVGARFLTMPRPIDPQTGEYSTKFSLEEWKALQTKHQEDFETYQSKAESQLNTWLDDNGDAKVTRAYYLDDQLVAVFGEDNINVSNGMNYALEYGYAQSDGENLGYSGDQLARYAENRVEFAMRREYGDRLTVKEGPAGTLGTLADYREDLFGGDRWPSADNMPPPREIDWDAPSPAQAGTWQGPLALIDTQAFLDMRTMRIEA